MDDIPTRAIIIGVNIFVTLTIVSLLIIMFSQMGEIYGVVKNTDTSISSKFDDIYSMYNGRVETGIGLLNAIKTFEEDNEYNLIITYPYSENVRKDVKKGKSESQYLKELIESKSKKYGTLYRYEDRYNVTVFEREDGKLEINFAK